MQANMARKRTAARAGLVAIGLSAIGLIAGTVAAFQSMSVAPAASADVRSGRSAAPVDVALEINRVQGDTTEAVVLDKVNDTTFARSRRMLTLQLGQATRFIMGGRANIRPGAVVMARGRVRSATLGDVDRVVILTSYVHVR